MTSEQSESVIHTSTAAVSGGDVEFRRTVWNEANKLVIDSLYSGRSQQVAAARWATVAIFLGLPSSLLAATASAGAAVSAAFLQDPRLTAGLALAATLLTAARAFLRPEDTARGYETKGSAYLALRNDAAQFRDVRVRFARGTSTELERELRELSARRNQLNSQPPIRVPTWAYRIARRSLETGESDYENDAFWVKAPF